MAFQGRGIDFVAYDDLGQVILLGEVKSRIGTSEQWAARFRRNMLSHGTLPKAQFFLIATPERMYFWKQDRPSASEDLPEFTVDAAQQLKPYFEKLEQAPKDLGEQALEFLVVSWLNDIARANNPSVKQDPSTRWLADSGLIDSLGKARIELTPTQ